MSATARPATWFQPPGGFENAAEWVRALGGIPLERIVFDPWPGTATEADLLRFVDRDKRLCELVDGTLVEKPVGLVESVVALNLARRLLEHVGRADAGIVSGADGPVRLSKGRVRMPDLGFYSRARLPGGATPRESIPTLSPDLAVEVLSEGNTPAEMAQKLREYFESGTRLAWIIDPRTRTVAVHRAGGGVGRTLAGGESLDGEDVLPGFAMPVADLFRNVPPGAGG